MASQKKVNWWANIPNLTRPMDLAVPTLAALYKNQNSVYKDELDHFCEFLSNHPLAVKHNKSKDALLQHMTLNIQRYCQNQPHHH